MTSVTLSLCNKVIEVLRKLPRIFVDSSIVYSFIQFYAALNGFIFLPGRGHARGSRGLDNKIGAAARCCENPGHNVPLETTHTPDNVLSRFLKSKSNEISRVSMCNVTI